MAGRFVPACWLLLASWSLTGCFRYVPVTSDTPPVTGEGRIVLTDAGTVAMQTQLGPGVREIDGVIIRLGADSIIMTVSQTTTSARERFTQQGATVAIARPLVQSVQRQTFSRSRTTVVSAVTAAIITIALRASSGFGFSGTGDSGGSIQP